MLIELTRGKHAIIDLNDADLAGRSWHAVPGHQFCRQLHVLCCSPQRFQAHHIASSDLRTHFGQEASGGRRMRPYRRQRFEQQKMQSETGGPSQKHKK